MRSGGTLSGYERHCAFLNLKGRRFATVSALSGFNFEDDGRALALMDWDRDGRIDLWTANRTAPQVRFLHNRCPRAGNWIALRLEGTESNRDAIGARVDLVVAGRDDEPPLSKSLKAGEGFLSQSSKWLHFGLGDSPDAVTLHIRWPNGRLETLADVPVNGHFEIKEGGGEAVLTAPIVARIAGQPNPRPLVVPSDVAGAAVFLHRRVPLPALPYDDGVSGRSKVWQPGQGDGDARSCLVNLWAEWCLPCRQELEEWTQNADVLRQQNVEVLALHALDVPEGGAGEARLMKELAFPFPWGRASAVTVDLLAKAYENVLGIQRALPVPVSFLISPQGEIAAIYTGRTKWERLLQDIERISLEEDARQVAAAPFSGRWLNNRPMAFHVLYIPVTLMRHGRMDEAVDFIQRQERLMLGSENYPLVLGGIAERLMQRGAAGAPTATQLYRRSVELDSDNVAILNNLAWQLATSPDAALRDGPSALRWARRAIQLAGENPGRLDTLAAALAENGQFEEAVRAAESGLQFASEQGLDAAVPHLQKALALYKVGKPYRSIP